LWPTGDLAITSSTWVLTEELKFDYLIGFRGNIKVTAADGEARAAIDWVGQRGRTRILRGAAVIMEKFGPLLLKQPLFADIYGLI
jgi:hypothetical protein